MSAIESARTDVSIGSTPAVDIREVTKRFGSLVVLDHVSVAIETGNVMCLIGPSGGGKSTLLRCVNALEVPDEGLVFVHGECIGWRERDGTLRQENSRLLARHRTSIGMVFQSFNLFPHKTALENVALGPRVVNHVHRGEAREMARASLASVGLTGKENNYPKQLSGGQQQRVAIARALVMQPDVMLFDEPTSALDPELVGEVLAVMEALASDGMTMLVATHEMQFARNIASQVAFLDNGRLLELGPPATVMDAPQNDRTAMFLAAIRRPL